MKINLDVQQARAPVCQLLSKHSNAKHNARVQRARFILSSLFQSESLLFSPHQSLLLKSYFTGFLICKTLHLVCFMHHTKQRQLRRYFDHILKFANMSSRCSSTFPRRSSFEPQCTHLTMTRVYGPELVYETCHRAGPFGWVYQCTQDREDAVERALFKGELVSDLLNNWSRRRWECF